MSGKNYGNDGFWPKGRGSKAGLVDWLATTGREKAMGNTFNAQTNVDIRAVATIDKFFKLHGILVRGTSELMRECVKMILKAALASEIEPITDIEEAIDYLYNAGYSTRQFDTYKKSRLATALRAEHLGKERTGQDVSAILGQVIVQERLAECGPEPYVPPPKDKYDLWAETRATEIQREKNIKIGYARYEADDEADKMRQAGVDPATYKEFLAQEARRAAEFEAQKKAEKEFLLSIAKQQGE